MFQEIRVNADVLEPLTTKKTLRRSVAVQRARAKPKCVTSVSEFVEVLDLAAII